MAISLVDSPTKPNPVSGAVQSAGAASAGSARWALERVQSANLDHLDAVAPTSAAGYPAIPQLAAPSPQAMEAEKNIYAVFVRLQEVIHGVSEMTMVARRKASADLARSGSGVSVDLTESFRNASEQYTLASSRFDQSMKLVRQAEQNVDKSGKDLKKATTDLETARSELATIEAARSADPGNATLQQRYSQKQGDVMQFQMVFNAENQKYRSQFNLLADLTKMATDASTEVVARQNDMVQAQSELQYTSIQGTGAGKIDLTDANKTNMQILMECIIKLAELISINSENKLVDNLRLYKEMQSTLQIQAEKNQKEYDEKFAEAERVRKATAIVSKIFNVFLLVICGIGVPLTGGASMLIGLAFTGFSASLLVADSVMEAQGLETASSKMMAPIMVQIQKLVECIADSLVKTSSLTEEEAQIIATVIAAVAIVVIIAVGTKAVNVASSGIGKLMPDVVKGMLSRIDAQLTSMLPARLISNPAAMSTALNMSRIVGDVVGTTTQAIMGIQEAVYENQAAIASANNETDTTQLENIADIIKGIVSAFCAENNYLKYYDDLSTMIDRDRDAYQHINRKMV